MAVAATRLDPSQGEAGRPQSAGGCASWRAKLVATGVGKSGLVARKIAATFFSIGLTAVFLNPVDALHGDLGIVAADEVELLLSNSGETEELLPIRLHLKRRGAARIVLVGRIAFRLAPRDPITVQAHGWAFEALHLMENNRRKPGSLVPVVGDDGRQPLGFIPMHNLTIQAGLVSKATAESPSAPFRPALRPRGWAIPWPSPSPRSAAIPACSRCATASATAARRWPGV